MIPRLGPNRVFRATATPPHAAPCATRVFSDAALPASSPPPFFLQHANPVGFERARPYSFDTSDTTDDSRVYAYPRSRSLEEETRQHRHHVDDR